MPQSLTIQLTHLVFSTREHRPWLDVPLWPELFSYQASVLSAHECIPIIINGVADHVHILFSLSKTKTLSEVVREVKTASSRWMKQQGVQYGDFAWQRGYAAFSVSPSRQCDVERYIVTAAPPRAVIVSRRAAHVIAKARVGI